MIHRFLFLLLSLLACFSAIAQEDSSVGRKAMDTLKPYQKYPTLPAFNIRMMDSVTIFNTYNIPRGSKTLIVFFSPDCKHCQQQVKELTNGMDSLEGIKLYLITPVQSMTDLRDFYKRFRLDKYKSIVLVGRDYEFFFGSFYGTRVVPDMVLYDEQKKLIKLFEGNNTVTEIYKWANP